MHRKPAAWWAESHTTAFYVIAEQYSLGAALGSCKIILLRTIRTETQDPTDVAPGSEGLRALPGPWPGAGGWGQLIICMVQLGAIFQFSLTRIQASFCRRKEANSPEVQFVHQYNLLLSHPLHTAPPLFCHVPARFHASNLSLSGDLLFDLAHLFSPQSVSAITASSEKSHLARSRVANKAGSGCAGSASSDQPAVTKHHLEANYFAVTERVRESREDKVWLPLLPQSLLPRCTASGHWSGKGPKSQQNDVTATKIKR